MCVMCPPVEHLFPCPMITMFSWKRNTQPNTTKVDLSTRAVYLQIRCTVTMLLPVG